MGAQGDMSRCDGKALLTISIGETHANHGATDTQMNDLPQGLVSEFELLFANLRRIGRGRRAGAPTDHPMRWLSRGQRGERNCEKSGDDSCGHAKGDAFSYVCHDGSLPVIL